MAEGWLLICTAAAAVQSILQSGPVLHSEANAHRHVKGPSWPVLVFMTGARNFQNLASSVRWNPQTRFIQNLKALRTISRLHWSALSFELGNVELARRPIRILFVSYSIRSALLAARDE